MAFIVTPKHPKLRPAAYRTLAEIERCVPHGFLAEIEHITYADLADLIGGCDPGVPGDLVDVYNRQRRR